MNISRKGTINGELTLKVEMSARELQLIQNALVTYFNGAGIDTNERLSIGDKIREISGFMRTKGEETK